MKKNGNWESPDCHEENENKSQGESPRGNGNDAIPEGIAQNHTGEGVL